MNNNNFGGYPGRGVPTAQYYSSQQQQNAPYAYATAMPVPVIPRQTGQVGLGMLQSALQLPGAPVYATAVAPSAPPPVAAATHPVYGYPNQVQAQDQAQVSAVSPPVQSRARQESKRISAISKMDVVKDPGQTVALPGPLPKSVEEFVAMRDIVAQTPEGGALMFCVAMYVYTRNKELGAQFLCVSIDADHVVKSESISQALRSPSNYKGFVPKVAVLRDMDRRVGAHANPLFDKTYIARSYFVGTSPENLYAVNESSGMRILVKRQRADAANPGRIFIVSSGADLPKPIKMRANQKGIWKAHSWSSLQCSVRPPKVLKPHEVDTI